MLHRIIQLPVSSRIKLIRSVQQLQSRCPHLHGLACGADSQNRSQPDNLKSENIHNIAKSQRLFRTNPLSAHVNAISAGVNNTGAAAIQFQCCMCSGNQTLKIINNMASLCGANLQLAGLRNPIFLEPAQILIQFHNQNAQHRIVLTQLDQTSHLKYLSKLQAVGTKPCVFTG